MKGIILAAGQGTRLAPYTYDRPKCMVEYNGKMIIDYILDSMNACGIGKQIIVDGYKNNVLKSHLKGRDVKFYTNEQFATTNMVTTLFCAEKEMDDDIIISYADIIYKDDILQKLITSDADIACVVDNRWLELWQQRMENPLDDAETMRIDDNGNIIELGKKAHLYNEIEAQYIGLIKISKNAIDKVRSFYNSLDRLGIYDGKDFDNMYMTSFLQMIIDELMSIQAVRIDGGWLEIDSHDDLTTEMCD